MPRWREQRQRVIGRVPVGEGPRGLGSAETPLVPGDAAEAIGEGGHLRLEHLVVHQETVTEDDGSPLSSRVLEVDVLAVDVREGMAIPLETM